MMLYKLGCNGFDNTSRRRVQTKNLCHVDQPQSLLGFFLFDESVLNSGLAFVGKTQDRLLHGICHDVLDHLGCSCLADAMNATDRLQLDCRVEQRLHEEDGCRRDERQPCARTLGIQEECRNRRVLVELGDRVCALCPTPVQSHAANSVGSKRRLDDPQHVLPLGEHQHLGPSLGCAQVFDVPHDGVHLGAVAARQRERVEWSSRCLDDLFLDLGHGGIGGLWALGLACAEDQRRRGERSAADGAVG
mmetsp:Transcript_14944/g.35143  ORF Transcript_14944/g.35143 Transcript_14944/m.35143 type:complete len:247 (-) Transcript_14944:1111-1851(-)